MTRHKKMGWLSSIFNGLESVIVFFNIKFGRDIRKEI
jgi:hypothetical protein